MQPVLWATYSLIAINVLIWLFLLSKVWISRKTADILLLWGGNAASEMQKGEWR